MSGDIYDAIRKVMAAVGPVAKSRTNPQQGYKFRGIDDVMAHLQSSMAEHGVICLPHVLERERENVPTKSGGTMASVRLLVQHKFYAADGSCVEATTLGEAMDSGDKASNKAMSAALKYALTESFMIPTYEADRDTEEQSPQMGQADLTAQLKASLVQQRGAPLHSVAAPVQAVLAAPASPSEPVAGYGKSKGKPASQLTDHDLAWYLQRSRESYADPAKEKWRSREIVWLTALENESKRRGTAQPQTQEEPPPPGDADAPF